MLVAVPAAAFGGMMINVADAVARVSHLCTAPSGKHG